MPHIGLQQFWESKALEEFTCKWRFAQLPAPLVNSPLFIQAFLQPHQKTLIAHGTNFTPEALLANGLGIAVSADGAYDTKACHAAIVARAAQAGIPPRSNAQPWKATLVGALARNEALKACHRLGRSIWKKWSGYHRRSLVETKMHGFKRLGERVMARTFERQVVELHVRVALLNRFTQLGRPTTVSVAATA